jgi:hypothetical protein
MAKFYGSVQGDRGRATRLGRSHGRGLKTTAQSYEGSVIVFIYVDQQERTCVSISAAQGSKASGDHSLYNGPIQGLWDDQFYLGR